MCNNACDYFTDFEVDLSKTKSLNTLKKKISKKEVIDHTVRAVIWKKS